MRAKMQFGYPLAPRASLLIARTQRADCTRNSQPVIGLGLVNGLPRGLQVRAGIKTSLAHLVEWHDLCREVEYSRDIELLNWCPIIQSRQELDFCGAQIRFGCLQVRFVLNALKL